MRTSRGVRSLGALSLDLGSPQPPMPQIYTTTTTTTVYHTPMHHHSIPPNLYQQISLHSPQVSSGTGFPALSIPASFHRNQSIAPSQPLSYSIYLSFIRFRIQSYLFRAKTRVVPLSLVFIDSRRPSKSSQSLILRPRS